MTTITYRRPLAASEPHRDKEVLTSRSQSVIAAFGPLNSRYEANAHSFMDTTRSDVQLDFGAMVSTYSLLRKDCGSDIIIGRKKSAAEHCPPS